MSSTLNFVLASPNDAADKIDEIEKRVEALEAALEFYADPECYKPQDRWCPARGKIQLQPDIQADNHGDKARAALEAK